MIPPATDCAAVILSGGLNTRMKSKNKAFLNIGGDTILNRLLSRLQPVFKEILLVTRDTRSYAGIPVKVVADLYEERSSLTGIHAGLTHARADFAFIVPCDTPFLQPAVIRLLLNELNANMDVVIPHLEGHYQPLCAIYSKRCLPVIETQLERHDFKIIHFFDKVEVKALSDEQVLAADPELVSFLNVNTPEAHLACQELIENKLDP